MSAQRPLLSDGCPPRRKQYGVTDPFNKEQAEAFIHKFTGDNLAQLTKALGRAPTSAEVYLAYQQGAAGAAKIAERRSGR